MTPRHAAAGRSGGRWPQLFVAAVKAVGTLFADAVSKDVERCRIATEFLSDDARDWTILSEARLERLTSLYVRMAEEYCLEGS